MKRIRIEIEDIASFNNLSEAAAKAAKGKKSCPDVINFFNNYQKNIIELRDNLLNGNIPYGKLNKFTIFDPKERIIHAPCFKDRVLHHSIMRYVGSVLDRAMVNSSFACREGRGVHAAVKQAQKNICRFAWYVKIDIKSYFNSIDHYLLLEMIKRRIKGDHVLGLIEKIISNYCTIKGKGLPIGALPSQHLANFYLDSLDRYILENLHANAHARYMDDTIWWCNSRKEAKYTLAQVIDHVEEKLVLEIKRPVVQVNKSKNGVTFCGFRIFPGKIRLSARKRLRYCIHRKKWENVYRSGRIDATTLQIAYASVYSITANSDSREWRRKQLRFFKAPDC